jgi:hypothetical protein
MRRLALILTAALFAAAPASVRAQTPPAGSAKPPASAPSKPAKPPKRDAAKDKREAPKPEEQQTAYFGEIMVLLGTNSKKGIDPRIGDMPELKKPPFSAYDSYELLTDPPLPASGKARLELKKDDPKTIRLPNGRVLQLRLLEVLPKDSVRISASINQPGGKAFLPLLEVKAKVGEKFIVAGQNYRRGMLTLVIRVVK